MMQLKARCDVWIASIWTGKETVVCVQAGIVSKPPEDWLKPYEYGEFYHLKADDYLKFSEMEQGSDPYAQLATRYPEWFERVE